MRLDDIVLENILLEYDRNKTIANYGPKLLAAAQKDISIPKDQRLLPNILDAIEQADPTKNKEYVQGIAKLYSLGGAKLEDIKSTLSDALTKFSKLKLKKKISGPDADFMRYRSFDDFYKFVEAQPDPQEEAPAAKGNSEVYYEDNDMRIIVPHNKEAACYYGQGTRWCTAASQNNMYDYYSQKDQMYIILLKHPAHAGEKYQFHFATKQFMDESDRRIDLFTLVDKYPQLRKVFKTQAEKYSTIELLTSKEEYTTKILPLLTKSSTLMDTWIKISANDLINEIQTQLMKGAGRDERYVIVDAMSELRVSLMRHPERLSKVVVDMIVKHPEVIGDEDGMYDKLTDYLQEWFGWEDFYAVLEEYYNDPEEGDPDAWMDVAMTIMGEMHQWCSKMINDVIADNIKQVLQK